MLKKVALALAIFLSIGIAGHAFLFQFGLSGGADFQARFASMPLFGTFHVLGSGVALLLGGFQFVRKIRTERINLHRWLGRIYLICVAIGGAGGLMMARIADGGVSARIGFFLLGVVWLVSAWQAYAAIRRGDVREHQFWMTRNFALTFAAVTLRIYLGVLQGGFGLTFIEAYAVVAWLCWVPNLIIAEWLLIRPLALRSSASQPADHRPPAAAG